MPKIEWNRKKKVIMAILTIALVLSIYQFIENYVIMIDVSYCKQTPISKENTSTGSTNLRIESGEKIQTQYSQKWIEKCCIIDINNQSEILLDCHQAEPIVLRKG